MAYQILVPTSDVYIDADEDYGIFPLGSSNYYLLVDDGESHDSNATYIYGESIFPNYVYAEFGLSNPVRVGTIDSVELHVIAKKTSSAITGYLDRYITTHGKVYGTYDAAVTTSYVDYTNTWSTNPKTGVAWTWDEVDALTATVGLAVSWIEYYYYYVNVTSIYIKVNFTPPAGAGGAQIIGLSAW